MNPLFLKNTLILWIAFSLIGGFLLVHEFHDRHARSRKAQTDAIEKQLAQVIENVQSLIAGQGHQQIVHLLESHQAILPNWLSLYLLNEENIEMLGQAVPLALLDQSTSQASAQSPGPVFSELQSQDGHTFKVIATAYPRPLQQPDGKTYLLEKRLFILLWLAVGLMLSMALSWVLMRPVRSMDQAMNLLARQTLSSKGVRQSRPRQSSHEIAESIRELICSQRLLLHDVSHELRSPLARLKVSLGLARQQPERVEHCLDRIEMETERLESLVNEVLTLSQIESGLTADTTAYQQYQEKIDLIELVDTVVDTARFEARNKPCHMEMIFDIDDTPIVMGYGEQLYRALENILRNAIHHTDANSTVNLTLRYYNQQSYAEIIIDDEGPGVSPNQLDKIFDPFFRGQNAQISYRGFGLGLTIAKRAIQGHAGRIKAQNRKDRGLRITIQLPTVQDA